jgi:hypothetical protein
MKSAARMALAAGAAYPLGRYHKLRWALMLAAFATTGRLESPGRLALRGAKELANSPELSEVTDKVRGQLIDAARAAVVSAATSSIGSLTDRLNDQTEALRKPADDAARGVSKAAGHSSSEDDEGEGDQTDESDDADAGDPADEERPRRRQPVSAGHRETRDRRDNGQTSRRRQAEGSDNGQGRAKPRRRPARSDDSGGGSPVRRRG